MLHPYKIWTNDGLIEKEDAVEIVHIDPRAAIEEFVETYDKNHCADMYFANYYSVGRPEPLVIFLQDKQGVITKWSLTVESVPQYHAMEIK